MSKTLIGLVFICISLCCFSLRSAAQSDVISQVQKAFQSYTEGSLQEKLFAHTDKEFYVAGDIVWIKIYAVEAATNRPSEASKVAYVEIIDRNNQPVSRSKIALNKNGGSGSIQLPITINSSDYSFRAYTNWMKNGGADVFFEKNLTIVNPLKTVNAASSEPPSKFHLALFPEGGNLVNGLPSRVAFHVTDNEGKGLEGKGFLLNKRSDTLRIFSPFKFGMGTFEFTPVSGDEYKMVFQLPGGMFISQQLPEPFAKGYVMNLEEADGNKLKVTVATNSTDYPEVFLVVHGKGKIQQSRRNILQNGIASFFVEKTALNDGVSQFTIFNGSRQPVAERLYFKQPNIKNRAVKSDQQEYGTRKNVVLTLEPGIADHYNSSLAVYQFDSLQKNTGDIVSYLWLTSELSGEVEDPDFYFSGDPSAARAADYLMLTQGWRRFDWETALNKMPAVQFPLEHVGQTITVKATDTKTNSPARSVQLFLSIPNTYYKLYASETDENGMATFNVKDFYGYSEIVVQPKDPKDSMLKLEVLNPFSESYTSGQTSNLRLSSSARRLIENYSVAMQAQQVYFADSIRRFAIPQALDTFPFYGRPMYKYNFDEYKRFTTMEEVLREYVREINVGVKGSGALPRVKLLNEDDREHYSDNILVAVDGVPLQNPNRIFSVDPLKIKSLGVITRNYIMGASVFHGLANFSSYSGNFEEFEIDPRVVTLDYEGLQLQRRFFSPDYSTGPALKSKKPDLRTTLFWEPNVSSKQISFYTGDNKGNFIVVLQGIDSSGNPVSSSTQFVVK